MHQQARDDFAFAVAEMRLAMIGENFIDGLAGRGLDLFVGVDERQIQDLAEPAANRAFAAAHQADHHNRLRPQGGPNSLTPHGHAGIPLLSLPTESNHDRSRRGVLLTMKCGRPFHNYRPETIPPQSQCMRWWRKANLVLGVKRNIGFPRSPCGVTLRFRAILG